MKKILLASILIIPSFFIKAQNVYFTNLHPQNVQGNINEEVNYKISNTLTNDGWVLKTNWWGGIDFNTRGSIKLKSLWGTVYVANSGTVGINTETPQHTLDVHGDFRVTSGINYMYYNGKGDLKLSFQERGSGGRAIVHDTNNTLSLNYDNDFTGGARIGNTFLVKGDNAFLQGKFEAKEIKVTLTPTADFVFDESYELPNLEKVEEHIKNKKHLPEIMSAKEMEKNGVDVGSFQIKLLQKIEELTLYIIDQNKEINRLKKVNNSLLEKSGKISQLESKIEKLILNQK